MNKNFLQNIYIIAIFFLGAPLSASDDMNFITQFPIYMYGDTSYIQKVYQFVSVYSSGIITGGSAVQTVIALGISISVLFAGWKAKDGGWHAVAGAVVAPMALILLFLVPSVDVHIVDKRVSNGLIDASITSSGGYSEVDGVPYAIAAIPSVSSTIISFFIESIDQNWTAIDVGQKFSTLGFQGMSEISKDAMVIANLSQMRDANTSADTDKLQSDLSEYVKKCLIIDGFAADKRNKYLLKTPHLTYPDMYDPANFYGSFGGEKVTIGDDNETTCTDAYTTYVVNTEDDIHTAMISLLKKKRPELLDPTSSDFTDAYKKQIGVSSDKISDIGKAMTIIAVQKAQEKDLDVAGIGISGVSTATELTIQRTLGSIRTEGLAKFEWMARTLPDAITILLGIMIGVFPIMILVVSFYGANAYPVIQNFFMGYIAINFNLVGLALVNNILSYYTSQHAAEAMVSYAGMPFGMTQINDFMVRQADLAGMAGIIGTAAIFGITPLVFKGESSGLAAATGAIGGMFKGDIEHSGQKALTDADAQMELDRQQYTTDGMSEEQASEFLSREGFVRPHGMSAVQAYNDMQKNYQQIGAANTAQILHSGNVKGFNSANYISGSEGQAMQKAGATAGLGANINGNGALSASIDDIATVGLEDGIKTGASIKATSDLRKMGGYDAEAVGAGMAQKQYDSDRALAVVGKSVMPGLEDFDRNHNDNALNAISKRDISDNNQENIATVGKLEEDNKQLDKENAESKEEIAKIKKGQEQNSDGHHGSSSPSFAQSRISLAEKSISDNNAQKEENQDKIDSLFDSMGAKGDTQEEKLNSAMSIADKSTIDAKNAQDDYENNANFNFSGTTSAALVATATSGALSEIGSANGALSTGIKLGFLNTDGSVKTGADATKAYMKGAALKTEQAMATQLGTGETGDENKAINVAYDDGTISGNKINATDDDRTLLKNSKDKDKKWDAKKIAQGQAVSQVHQETQSQGSFNALDKEGNFDKAFLEASAGAEEAGRVSENVMLGKGKEWDKMKDSERRSMMGKVQENSKVQEYGGIEATNEEIHKHNKPGMSDTDAAIKDMKTSAQAKGIQSAADAKALGKYDTNNDGNLDDEAKLLSDKAEEKAKTDNASAKDDKAKNNVTKNEDAKSALIALNESFVDAMNDPKITDKKAVVDTLGAGSVARSTLEKDLVDTVPTKADQANYDKAVALEKSSQEILDNKDKSMSLQEVSELTAAQKLDSQLGQAAGIKKNNDAGVSYTQNAMYGEMSQQQSTQAKIATQGGVDAAVGTDVTDASLKASKQQASVESELAQQIKSNNPEMSDKVAKDIAKAFTESGGKVTDDIAKALSAGVDINALGSSAITSAGALAGTMVGGKTASDIASVGKYDSAEQYAESQAKGASQQASKEKAKMLLDKDLEANGTMANEMIYRAGEGYVGEQKEKKMRQAEAQMEKAGLIERQEDGSFKAAVGTKFSDAMAVLNSGDMGRDSQVQIAGTSMNIDRDMDGNSRITATSKEGVERGESLSYSVSGYGGAVGVGIAMGAGALASVNQYSKHMASEKIPMKMDDMHGAKPDGNGGFIDSNGKEFTLNDKGEVTRNGKVATKDNPNYKKGFVKAGWDKQWEKVKKVSAGDNSKTNEHPVDKTTDSSDDIPSNKDTDHSSQSNENDVSHKKSPNINSEDSVPKDKESVKSYENGGNPTTPSQEIDKQTTAQRRDEEMSNAQKVRDNKLAVADSPEAVEKINNEYEAKSEAIKEHYPTQEEKAIKHQTAMENAEKMMEKQKLAKPKGRFARAMDAADGVRSPVGKLLAFGVMMLAGEAVASAATPSISPSDVAVPKIPSGAGSALETASDTTGWMETVGGLGTMAAQTMSRFSGAAMSVAKVGSKVMPGVGAVAGAADVAYRTSKGDYWGAAMSGAIGAVSTVPVIGTTAAVVGSLAQVATDSIGITGTQQQEPLVQPKQSPAPASAQNAFSQKTGSNTSAAIEKDFKEGNIKPLVPEQSNPETSSGTQAPTQTVTPTQTVSPKVDANTQTVTPKVDTQVPTQTVADATSGANANITVQSTAVSHDEIEKAVKSAMQLTSSNSNAPANADNGNFANSNTAFSNVPPQQLSQQQNFVQPLGSTSAIDAMNSTSVNENSRFVTAGEVTGANKTDHGAESARVLENMNTTTDASYDNTADMAESIADLTEAMSSIKGDGQ